MDNKDDGSEELDYSALFEKWNQAGPVLVEIDSMQFNDHHGSKSYRGIPGAKHIPRSSDLDKEGFWPPAPDQYVETVDSVRGMWNSLLDDDIKHEAKPLRSVPIEEIESEFQACGVKRNYLDETRRRMLLLVGREDRGSVHKNQPIQVTNPNRKIIPQTVPDAELFAIGAYTEKYAFTALNKSLWTNTGTKKFPGFSRTLIKALRHLPYVWDVPLYHGGMRTTDLESLEEGDLVTWKGFMSTSRDKKIAENFLATKSKDDHCLYSITAWNGRSISDYSKYRYEKEVLLPPYSLFQINKKRYDPDGILVVEMEEMLIWRGSKCVLWVDDKHANNKLIMEKAELTGTNFVLATTTEEAIRFILFESHKALLSKYSSNLRVITDMSREEDGNFVYDAGAKLISKLRHHGYNETVMVFGNRETQAKENLKNNGVPLDKVIVTRDFNQAYKFCTFNVKDHLGQGNPVISVTVHAGKDLAAKDLTGTSDPYCKIDLLRNGKLMRCLGKTDVVWKELNPRFRRRAFQCVLNDTDGDLIPQLTLRITVMDRDKYTKDDFMGVVHFNLAQHQRVPLMWFKLHKRHKKWEHISGDLLLEYRVQIPVDDFEEEELKVDDYYTHSGGIGGEDIMVSLSDDGVLHNV